MALLRAMTFNVRHGTAADGPDRWELRRDRARSVLAKHRPDLVGLQEALDFQVDELSAVGYVSVGVGRDDGVAAGEHCAILYDPARLRLLRADTFWLSPTPSAVGTMHPETRHARICTWAAFIDRRTGDAFVHFNTHLDHESQAARESGLDEILSRLPDAPALVTGDFNAGESNPVHDRWRAAGLRDAYRAVHPEGPEPASFNGWEDEPGGERIDYVLVGGAARIVEAAIVRERPEGRWPSDHMPVTATVEFGR